MKKFDGYKEAFTRISTSISGRYFFEAVTIEESIITDRILSYFKNNSSETKFKSLQNESFHKIVSALKEEIKDPISTKKIKNLQEEIDQWRMDRNKIIHNIVRDKSYTGDSTIEDFIKSAEGCAKKGLILARAISDWVKIVKTKDKVA